MSWKTSRFLFLQRILNKQNLSINLRLTYTLQIGKNQSCVSPNNICLLTVLLPYNLFGEVRLLQHNNPKM